MNYCRLGMLLVFTANALHAQPPKDTPFRNRLGTGGWYSFYEEGGSCFVSASFGWLMKNENEIHLQVFYWNHSHHHEVFAGPAYKYSLFKRKGRFDIRIVASLSFHHHWYGLYVPGRNNLKTGAFALMGIEPMLNLPNRFSLSFNYTGGYGYAWAETITYKVLSVMPNSTSKPGDVVSITEKGWYTKGLYALILSYKL